MQVSIRGVETSMMLIQSYEMQSRLMRVLCDADAALGG